MTDECVTRIEFDKAIGLLKDALEQAINMATISGHIAIFSLKGKPDMENILLELETSLKNTENNFLYSPVSDQQISRYRESYKALLKQLKLSL